MCPPGVSFIFSDARRICVWPQIATRRDISRVYVRPSLCAISRANLHVNLKLSSRECEVFRMTIIPNWHVALLILSKIIIGENMPRGALTVHIDTLTARVETQPFTFYDSRSIFLTAMRRQSRPRFLARIARFLLRISSECLPISLTFLQPRATTGTENTSTMRLPPHSHANRHWVATFSNIWSPVQ